MKCVWIEMLSLASCIDLVSHTLGVSLNQLSDHLSVCLYQYKDVTSHLEAGWCSVYGG